MTTTELTSVVTQCETVAAVARLAETIRPAESATIRLPEGSLAGLSPQRDIVIRFAREDDARQFLAALEAASRKLS